MTTHVNTIVIGAGQAGLSVSYYLTQHDTDHVVLEQADQPGDAWRNHRWDSFTLNTPNWQSRLPGARPGNNPDGFMSRPEVVAYLEDFARQLPVRYGVRVSRVERDSRSGQYLVVLDYGERIQARNVVIATGLYQTPKIPAFAVDFPAGIRQIHSDTYRNPQALLPGAVLVVGSAQSGAQIAEELYEAGRKVYLATGRAGRTPRRYRGKDANWWFARLGVYDHTVSDLKSPRAKFSSKPHISGTRGGHTLNLHQFARDGVVLLGHLQKVHDGVIHIAPDLHDNLAAADGAEAGFVKSVDSYIAATGILAPEEKLPALRDGFEQPALTELDLAASGITNVIWATGYRFDFSMVKLPVVDPDGFPLQQRGVTAFPGLYFVGLPWLHTAKSGLIYGVGEDAAYIAQQIATATDPEELANATLVPRSDPLPVMAAARWPRLFNLLMKGFGLYGAGHHPTAVSSVELCPADADAPRSTKRTSLKMLLMAMIAAAAVGTTVGVSAPLMLTTSEGTRQDISAPLPPSVTFVPFAARQLHLGMTAADVTRIMGEAEKDTSYVSNGIPIRKLTFSTGSFAGKVKLANDRVLGVALDVFQNDNDALPAFAQKAWHGMHSTGVRRMLGDPDEVRHHVFFGIKLDQMVFHRSGEPDVSVFLVTERVVARTVGQSIPLGIFRIELPSPPDRTLEGPQLGMTESEVRSLYGAVKLHVDYLFNGRSASHEIYETVAPGSFASFTFVNGIVTEFEDLGRLPDDVFQAQ